MLYLYKNYKSGVNNNYTYHKVLRGVVFEELIQFKQNLKSLYVGIVGL